MDSRIVVNALVSVIVLFLVGGIADNYKSTRPYRQGAMWLFSFIVIAIVTATVLWNLYAFGVLQRTWWIEAPHIHRTR